MMSAVPALVCRADTVKVYSGFSTDITGLMHWAPVPHFSFFWRSEMTANSSISEPVAESVSTA